MSSDVALCNLALSHIGSLPNVTSISPPDGGAYAAHCARYFPVVISEVLEQHPWSWAIKRDTLASTTGDVAPPQYPYAYALPSDCLRVLAVFPHGYSDESGQQVKHVIESGVLYCAESTAPVIKYIWSQTDLTRWSQMARTAASWRLAQYLAGVIVKGDASLRTFCNKQFMYEIVRAATFDAAGSNDMPDHVPEWLRDL